MASSFRTRNWIVLITSLILILQSISEINGDFVDDEHLTTTVTTTNTDILRSKSFFQVKLWCLIFLFLTTFALGIAPYFFRSNESFLLLGTQFAGGVFLGSSLMHLLGESNSPSEILVTKGYYPVWLASGGYFLTMLGDCLVNHFGKGSSREDSLLLDGEKAAEEDEHVMKMTQNSVILTTTPMGDTVLLIVFMCSHSVFEGMALGLGVTDTGRAVLWRHLCKFSLETIFEAVAIGIAVLRMKPKRPFLVTVAYSFAFAISSPVGVQIGTGIDATTRGLVAHWMVGFSMGLGVFIYVALNDLIARGFEPEAQCIYDTAFCKFVSVLVGVGVIAIIMIF